MKTRLSLVIALLVTVIFGGAAFFVIRKWRPGRPVEDARTPEESREERTRGLVEVAPARLPTKTPLVGGDRRDADGYPVAYVEQGALRSLLFHRKFDELNRYFTEFQDAFEADPRNEYWPIDAADAFESTGATLDERLEEWIKGTPTSFVPYLARGAHLANLGFLRRGGKYASETAQEDFAAMADAHAGARADLERALTMRPKLVAAMRYQIQIASAGGTRADKDAIIARALAACPACMQIRVTYLRNTTPRWGGTYDAMRAFARSADPKANPRFRALEGYIDEDRAWLLLHDDKHAEAKKAIDRALALAPHADFFLERARIHVSATQFADAYLDVDRARLLRPGNTDILFERALVLLYLKRWEDAGNDLLHVLRIDPTVHNGRWARDTVSKGLQIEGWKLFQEQKNDEALRRYDLAAELDPMNRRVLGSRAHILESGKTDIASLEAAHKAAPDDLRALQRLDYALAKERKLERVVELWNAFIEKHPEEGRAYMERAGTHHRLGKRAEAKADAAKACALGISEGCARAK